MRPNLTHLALHVQHLDACIAFYEDYCGMHVIHERAGKGSRIVWMAERGREREFIFVLLPGGPGRKQEARDYGHLGFALESRAAVDAIAERARGRLPGLGAGRRALPGRLLLRPGRPRRRLRRVQLRPAAGTRRAGESRAVMARTLARARYRPPNVEATR